MSNQTTRRDFLRNASVVGAGVWTSSLSSSARAATPNEKLNVAVIGVEGRGAANRDAVAKLENIVALCDVDETRLGKAGEKYPKAKRYVDFRRMLDQQRDIDAVVVATPDHTHAVCAIAAMQRGKHVYCEKPLAHSVYEARLMAKTARNQGIVTQMGNQMHASDKLRRVVELVRDDVIGKVRDVFVWSNKSFSGGDRPLETHAIPKYLHWDLWLGPAPYRPYHAKRKGSEKPTYSPFYWRGWWDFGTGNFGDMACHLFDAPYWALDLGYPDSMVAVGPPVHPEGTPPWVTVRYEFPAHGERPAVRLTWSDGVTGPPLTAVDGVKLPLQGSLLIGDKGKLLFPHMGGEIRLLPEERFIDVKLPARSLPRPHEESPHAEWIDGIKTGSKVFSNFDYGAQLTETIMAGVVAYRIGRQLQWDGPNMKATNCPEADGFIRPQFRKGWEV